MSIQKGREMRRIMNFSLIQRFLEGYGEEESEA
jgi:hypothetical protein